MYGRRPTATSTTSASMVSVAPPAAGSTSTCSALPFARRAVTFVPSWNFEALLRRARAGPAVAISPSMPGRMRSRNSTTVTSAPSRATPSRARARWRPRRPRAGASAPRSSASASVEMTIRFPSIGDARERRRLASRSRSGCASPRASRALPSAARPRRVPAPAIRAACRDSASILFFLNRNATPLRRSSDDLVLARHASRRGRGRRLPTRMPCAAKLCRRTRA